MTQKKTHTLSLLAAITAAVIFGMSFMFSKLALEKAAPTVLLAVRFTVAIGLDTFGFTKAGAALCVFAGVWLVTKSKSRAQLDADRLKSGN